VLCRAREYLRHDVLLRNSAERICTGLFSKLRNWLSIAFCFQTSIATQVLDGLLKLRLTARPRHKAARLASWRSVAGTVEWLCR
jgi:hypothetical protein